MIRSVPNHPAIDAESSRDRHELLPVRASPSARRVAAPVDISAFGELVRMLRNRYGERGMSLTELARRTGLDKAYLHRLESGERENPSWRAVILIARALELSERLTNEMLERAYYAPLPSIVEYDGRFRRRGWGARLSD